MTAAQRLFNARRLMAGGAGKKTGSAKGLLAALKQAYDDYLHPLLGGKEAKDSPPDETIETLFAQALPLVGRTFAHLLETYQTALRLRQALDFDDLEAGAARLLALPELSAHWQAEVDAVLVDEFQDTNARQNAIVLALCGQTPGRLFVVGDPRQSIYRFRQADVTVFKQMTQTARSGQDRTLALDLTYRSHEPLLTAMGALLAAVMGEQDDPERPYYVPYTALKSNHSAVRPGILAPHIEFVLGGGEDAETARPEAARAMAQRLLELRQAGQVQRWDDVTLLFRASSGFPAYEQAFEEAAIPFVTVAGKGFYDRPEIRDVLNLLRALADPWDDLAMAGALRSPAFGLSDAALYQLRRGSGSKQPYWSALQGSLENLGPADQGQARRARQIFAELQPLADRLPVAELLKRLVDRVDYRAILASVETGSRLWRNLDKLLADAQVSELVNVRAFLEYLETLKDVGAREGEAPTEAEGAVRLMTIHKAKGLEFPLVVLADASRQRPKGTSPVYLLAGEGQNPPAAAFKLDLLERPPLLMRLAQLEDNLQSEAEELRLLYVALTRAKEKLLISGHCKTDKAGSWKADGWLQTLASAAKLDLTAAFETGQPDEIELTAGPLRVWARTAAGRPTPGPAEAEPAGWASTETISLVGLLAGQLALPALPLPQPPDHRQDAQPNWRAVRSSLAPPTEALGKMVHRALQRWLFPGQPGLTTLLSAAGREAGIAAPAQLAEALHQAELLLGRLQQHPLWQEINQAPARFHEVPFSYSREDKKLDSGYFDLLYRSPGGWEIVDFKTDSIASPAERARAVENHSQQMQRYAAAARSLLNEPARVRLCFLDDEGGISLE